MIISRGLNLLKFAYRTSQSKIAVTNLQSVRLCHGPITYREIPPVEMKWIYIAEVFGGIMWWWVLWHFWHDSAHLTGEFPYPDPAQWTDEELGIPPDDYDDSTFNKS